MSFLRDLFGKKTSPEPAWTPVTPVFLTTRLKGEPVVLRYSPRHDISAYQVSLLVQLSYKAHANPYRKETWGDWLAEHGLLQHFEVVE